MWVGLIAIGSLFCSIGFAGLVFGPRLGDKPTADHIRAIQRGCEGSPSGNPYAPPSLEHAENLVQRYVEKEIPKVLKANYPTIGHADISAMDKFLRQEWVRDSHEHTESFADVERAKMRALFYMADYVSLAPLIAKERSPVVEQSIANSLYDFAMNANTLSPDVRDRLFYAMAQVNRRVKIPNIGEALARWAIQGDEPPGMAFFDHLSRITAEPLDSGQRPPLGVVLDATEMVIDHYKKSRFENDDDKNDVYRARDYLEALAKSAEEAKDLQTQAIAGDEYRRLNIIIKEKRDPVRFRRRRF